MKAFKVGICTLALMFTVGVFATGCSDECQSRCDKMKKHYKGKDVAGYVTKCVEMCKKIKAKQ